MTPLEALCAAAETCYTEKRFYYATLFREAAAREHQLSVEIDALRETVRTLELERDAAIAKSALDEQQCDNMTASAGELAQHLSQAEADLAALRQEKAQAEQMMTDLRDCGSQNAICLSADYGFGDCLKHANESLSALRQAHARLQEERDTQAEWANVERRGRERVQQTLRDIRAQQKSDWDRADRLGVNWEALKVWLKEHPGRLGFDGYAEEVLEHIATLDASPALDPSRPTPGTRVE